MIGGTDQLLYTLVNQNGRWNSWEHERESLAEGDLNEYSHCLKTSASPILEIPMTSSRYIPTSMVFEILLHLSVEEILICRHVCKAWRRILSDPQFTKQYFSGAARIDAYPLIRPVGYSRVSREIHFVDPKHYVCDTSTRLKLGTKFKIPLYNFGSVLKSESYLELTQESGGRKRKRCLKLNPDDHFLKIMNTCNGFLCLTRFNNVIISNPMNGEFVNVQVPTVAENEICHVRYALGFCASTNTYKVIRLFGQNDGNWWNNFPSTGYQCLSTGSAQICTLGSTLWENIGLAPAHTCLHYPTFLKGKLNWVYDEKSRFIVSFDFDRTRFDSFSLPSLTPLGIYRPNIRIGVLRDQLCCCASESGYVDIWVMSKDGVQGAWTKVCNVSLRWHHTMYGFFQPITRLESGAIIMFHNKSYQNYSLIYYEPEMQILKNFKIKGMTAKFEAIGYTPTCISLKDVLVGNEVKVLNINSRCSELKIERESSPLYLMQENIA